MMTDESEEKVSKTLLKTADRYLARMRKGERILRDANGRLQWASGKSVGVKTINHMLSQGQIIELDADLFGDFRRGQTLGVAL